MYLEQWDQSMHWSRASESCFNMRRVLYIARHFLVFPEDAPAQPLPLLHALGHRLSPEDLLPHAHSLFHSDVIERGHLSNNFSSGSGPLRNQRPSGRFIQHRSAKAREKASRSRENHQQAIMLLPILIPSASTYYTRRSMNAVAIFEWIVSLLTIEWVSVALCFTFSPEAGQPTERKMPRRRSSLRG